MVSTVRWSCIGRVTHAVPRFSRGADNFHPLAFRAHRIEPYRLDSITTSKHSSNLEGFGGISRSIGPLHGEEFRKSLLNKRQQDFLLSNFAEACFVTTSVRLEPHT